MGSICTREGLEPFSCRKCQTPTATDQVRRLRQEQQYGLFERTLAETFQSALGNLWWAGLVRWFFVPANLAMGALYSECSSGFPLHLYVATCLATIFGWMQERRAIRTLVSFPQRVAVSLNAAENAVVDEELNLYLAAYAKALAAAASSSCAWQQSELMQQQHLLPASGLLSALSLVTGALMPGQVKQCELLHPELAGMWGASWLRIPDAVPILKSARMSNLFLAVFVIIMLCHGGEGVCEAAKARRLASAFCEDSLEDGDPPDCCDCSWPGWLVWHGIDRKVITLSISGTVIGEWAAAMHAKAIFTELSGEYARIEGDAGKATDDRRISIQMAHLVRIILLQYVPCMLLTQSFFSQAVTTLDQYGLAQVTLAFALSVREAFMQATAVAAMTLCDGPCSRMLVPPAIGLAAFLVTARAVAEFAITCSCPRHSFDWSRWSCANASFAHAG